ncbi:unnamed protein product [Rotaria sordida]|uniref:Uncharacterized protein n=1 Tax=Rotaria sordida TaxID=392033 RepID=A0A813XDM0_9BILA|nr:unnamed protein product [Rotaria sordida]CAF0868474.1 unnamed protein product [Rotaria sordida]CAF0884718.1 unnamed protein product [Rotaria sordida]CAF1005648.1 unnamed protein product [Rotaria sordida]CAF1102611.1 unnamed protein product [Rotaria sordida]
MLSPRIILFILIILLLLNCYCQGRNEIRNAVKAKGNRKVNAGRQNVRLVKDKTRGKIDRTDAKINRKRKNTRRKMQVIKHIIKS